MSEKNSSQKAQGFFIWGRDLSMWVEAGIIGFLPLILFILELISAYAEASLVNQVMPYFGNDSFVKALIYTGAGMAAGIYFSPNLAWYLQCKAEIIQVKRKTYLSDDFKTDTINNLLVAKRRFQFTAFFCLAVALISHGITWYFMEVAFHNKKTLELLNIANMGEVPYTLAISVSVMGFALDILLGLTTSARIDPKDYYPSNTKSVELIEISKEYDKLAQDESAHLEKIVAQRVVTLKNTQAFAKRLRDIDLEIEKAKKEDIDPKSKAAPNTNTNNTKDNKDNKNNDAKKVFGEEDKQITTSTGVPIWKEKAMDVFFATIFKRDGITLGGINDAINQNNLRAFEAKYALPLAESFKNLQDLYEEKYNLRKEDKATQDIVIDKLATQKLKALAILKDMGVKFLDANKGKRKHKK